MSKNVYIGVNKTSRKITNIYIGVNGVARKVIKGYIGVNGVARQFYSIAPQYLIENQSSVITSWYARRCNYNGTTVLSALPENAQTGYIYSMGETSNTGRFMYVVSANKIDLSGYKYIYAEIESNGNFGMIMAISDDNTSPATTNRQKGWETLSWREMKSNNPVNGVIDNYCKYVFNISSLTGFYYIKFGAGYSGTNGKYSADMLSLILTNDLSDLPYYKIYD